MRLIALIALPTVTLFLGSAEARAAPWCANYAPDNGTNCGFYTIEQCRAAISGVGGYCTPNPLESPATRRRNSRGQ